MNYLAVEQIIETNKAVASRFGDAFAVTHKANLEYAIEAMQYKYAGSPDAVFLKAAYLLDMLANKAHAFADGNKRTAMLVTLAFLNLNGYELSTGDQEELAAFMLEVARGGKSLNQIKKWLQEKVKRK